MSDLPRRLGAKLHARTDADGGVTLMRAVPACRDCPIRLGFGKDDLAWCPAWQAHRRKSDFCLGDERDDDAWPTEVWGDAEPELPFAETA